MKLNQSIDISEIASQFNLEIICNNYKGKVTGINEIHKVNSGDITFVDTAKYYDVVLNSEANFIIINQRIECPENKCLIYSDNPFKAYNEIALAFRPFEMCTEAIAKDAQIGENTKIFPNVFIGNNVKIGKNCVIYPNVSIYPNTIIGDNVIIQSNSAIGSEAFYYNKQGGEYLKMHTIGDTVIEDGVEIGSNCSVDAGVSGTTRIGKGTKLDNQIHIAHGVVIGEHCLLCAQVAIAGKTTIGNNVVLYGKVGISKGLTIGDNAVILASSNVDKNLEGNMKYFGSPAVEARQAMKYFATLRMLPDYIGKIKHLIKEDQLLHNNN